LSKNKLMHAIFLNVHTLPYKLMHAIFLNVHTLPYKLLIEGRYMCVQQQIN